MSRLLFNLEAKAPGSRARAATYQTLHGPIETPLFMPVGTQATVRTQTNETLKAAGSQCLLANTYHLYSRPGLEVFEKLDGIHAFMGWKGAVLTDSGGFQIFSLPHSRTMTEEGASFHNPASGQTTLLTPELSIAAQKSIGSDIMMALDQCVPSTCDRATARDAMELTRRWARRSLNARGDSPQALFGIVQGACFEDLRRESAQAITAMDFDGYAVGGLAVGEDRRDRERMTEVVTDLLPQDKPRYLMGVGTPIDLLEGVHRGIDQFDCIIPTSYAQRGGAFTSQGFVQLRRGAYRLSEERLDSACSCSTCALHSRAYLHHLIKCEEVLGWQLLALHNIHFYHSLMRDIRASILSGRFLELYGERRELLARSDGAFEKTPPPRSKNKLRLGDYEVVASAEGYGSIRQITSGQTMHSVSAPEDEARKLYVEQSQLSSRLEVKGPELVLWDVGLGAAANAMTAVRAAEALELEGKLARRLRIVSFESDLDSLKLALRSTHYFPYLRHPAPAGILKRGVWESGEVRWELRHGDFLALFPQAPRPDLIFYDMFSSKESSPHWDLSFFESLRAHCEGRPAELYTYSASTAVRAAMLCAGLYVGSGVGTGPKKDTTIGYTSAPQGAALLGAEWLERWERSSAREPLSAPRLLSHPQFAKMV